MIIDISAIVTFLQKYSILIVILIGIIVIGILSKQKKLNKGTDKMLSGGLLLQIGILSAVSILIISIFHYIHIAFLTDSAKEGDMWAFIRFIDPGSVKEDLDTEKSLVENFRFIFAALTSIFGMIFLSGLLISVLTNYYNQRIERFTKGEGKYTFSNHLVIFGYDHMALPLIKKYLQQKSVWYKRPSVVLVTERNVEEVRRFILSNLENKDEKRIYILQGVRNLKEEIERVSIDKAKQVVILGEKDEEGRDTKNIDCLIKVADERRDAKLRSSLTYYVHFEDEQTYRLAKEFDLYWLGTLKSRLLKSEAACVEEYFTKLSAEESVGIVDDKLNERLVKLHTTFSHQLKNYTNWFDYLKGEVTIAGIADTICDYIELVNHDFDAEKSTLLLDLKRFLNKCDIDVEEFNLFEDSKKNHAYLLQNKTAITAYLEVIHNDVKNVKQSIGRYIVENIDHEYPLLFKGVFKEEFESIVSFSKTCDTYYPFNFYEMWAESVFVGWEHQIDKEDNRETYKPLDYEPLSASSDKHVHLVLLGCNRMAHALAIEAARIAHFPNFISGNKVKKEGQNKGQVEINDDDRFKLPTEHKSKNNCTKITIIDIEAKKCEQEFKKRYPEYQDIEDVNIEFMQGDATSPEVGSYLVDICNEKTKLPYIAVCFSYSEFALTVGMNLSRRLFTYRDIDTRSNNNIGVPIIIRQRHAHELHSQTPDNVEFFGTEGRCIDFDCIEKKDKLAMLYNFHYSKQMGYLGENIEDNEATAIREWNNLSQEKKWSNRYTINSFYTFERSGVLGKKNSPLPSMEHRRWCAERYLSGWINGERNDLLKIHKDLIPYAEMEQGDKDKNEKLSAIYKEFQKEIAKIKAT